MDIKTLPLSSLDIFCENLNLSDSLEMKRIVLAIWLFQCL